MELRKKGNRALRGYPPVVSLVFSASVEIKGGINDGSKWNMAFVSDIWVTFVLWNKVAAFVSRGFRVTMSHLCVLFGYNPIL